jgi:membrane fusion protein (multidrug efflux system)
MKKRMLIMLLAVALLFGLVFGYKIVRAHFMMQAMAAHFSNISYVSTTKVSEAAWQPQFKAVGGLRAVLGVNITTELAGMVRHIYFAPGAMVQPGEILAELNIAPDVAQLHQLEANADLARINYHRDKAQYKIHAVSRAIVDTDRANLKSAMAQVEQQRAIIDQKIIRAPFGGRLGINQINPGQYLNPGDTVTMLQSLDPIYVDFYVPQQWVGEIQLDQAVDVTIDTFPGQHFTGKITTLNPALDAGVRNLQVEATLSNASFQLLPGMFANVTVDTGLPKNYLTIPQAAISYNPYGSTVFVVKEQGQDSKGQPILIAEQVFVTPGETRGDQVQVLSGLKLNDVVITSGQLKLQNHNRIAINNQIQPTDEPTSKPLEPTS